MQRHVEIRPASAPEADVLTTLAMASKAYWGYTDAFMKACRGELAVSPECIESERFFYAVAVMDGEIAGYYGLEFLSGNEVELDAMFVRPGLMGGGIGQALMAHARSVAVTRGARSMLIESDPHAVKFYRAAGAHVVGSRESASIPGRSLPLLRLTLEAGRGDAA